MPGVNRKSINEQTASYRKQIGLKCVFISHQKADATICKHIADYLIKAINDACDTWEEVNWNKDYDESLFFNYVLPYRI